MKKRFLPLLFISSLCFGQVNLNLGLKAYYPFSGNANDLSGNNNNPVFNNATLVPDRFGNSNSAYHFNGTSSYMKILNSPTINFTNQLSICAWVKPQGFYTGPCHGNSIMMKGDADYLTGNYFLRYDDGYSTGYNNCSTSTVDMLSQNFYGSGSPGYTPYIQANQWYSVILTYDGATAKLYVNCELKVSVPQVSTTFTNSYDLYLGSLNNASFPYWLNGDLDEVRIYNRALTVDEVKVLSDCPVSVPPLTNVINSYTPVMALNLCDNALKVEDASTFNPGDTVLIIQMKGAVIDSANTSGFGTVTDYKNSGNYEFNIIKEKNGNSLSLLNVLERKYDVPNGKVQLIRVPYYTTADITSTLTCLPWDGSKGGVLVLNARNSVNMSADIDVSGKGFKGGQSPNPNNSTQYCNYDNFYYPANTPGAAAKGESISDISSEFAWGKGAPSNGGGGGSGHNSGGGGGSNGGQGGFGGYQLDACGGSATDNRGIGGNDLPYNNVSNKVFLGGGGGSGHTDNAGGSDTNGANGGGVIIIRSPVINNTGFKINAKGADIINCSLSPIDLCYDGSGGGGGGGSVLIESNNFTSSTSVDISGGKGGDLVVYQLPNATHIGPGGGGGAGVFWTNSPSAPANITVIKDGGKNGVIIQDADNPYGATPGQDGISLFNLKIPTSTILSKLNNIDSIRISDSIYNCYTVDFKGLAFTNSYPISNWSWNFGDVRYSDSQNVTHTYTRPGVKFVKLFATDINGCQDSIVKIVIITQVNIRKRPDTSLCGSSPVKMFASGGTNYVWSPAVSLDNPYIPNPVATPLSSTTYYVTVSNPEGCVNNDSVKIRVKKVVVVSKSKDTSVCQNTEAQLLAGGGVSYAWTPVSSLSNPKIANPVARPTSNTTYTVKVTNADGCSKTDSIVVAIKPVPVITKSNDMGVCVDNTTAKLFITGGISYSWSPSSTLDNAVSATPVATPLSTTVYHVVITDAQLCNYDDSVKVTVNPLPTLYVSKLNDINCSIPATQLFASGAQDYTWTPSIGLNNTEVSNPIASPIVSTTYNVIGKDINGCVNSGTISVNVDFSGSKVYGLPNAFTPNGDGLNDCFGIKYWGHVTELSFIIYNRLGEKIFYTN
ncbi:MAG: LamG-like jellyroll fold domain-containing protein, partial [Ginsengibacter sp.]